MKRIILLALVVISHVAQAQQPYKFGTISKAELQEQTCAIDSTADAAILYSKRYTYFDFTGSQGYSSITNYVVRIKIYTKAGAKWATKKIYLYNSNTAKEKATGVKGITYNLEQGEIVKTKLQDADIYVEKRHKYLSVKKFTMPNIRPGSVIEYKYTIKSPLMGNIRSVLIQQTIPVKKREAQIVIPEFYIFQLYPKGYLSPGTLKTTIQNNTIQFVSRLRTKNKNTHNALKSISIPITETVYTINSTNVPALKREPYAGNINNYKAQVVFELKYVDFPTQPRRLMSASWNSVTKRIYSESFGRQLNKTNFFKAELAKALANTKTKKEKLNRILAFVKKKIKWNSIYGVHTYNGVKKSYKTGEGNVADININLVNMLNQAGFKAYPVLVSTTKHGTPLFPTLKGFNYVIAYVLFDDGSYALLDATDKYAMPNILPQRVYNFQGRVIYNKEKSQWINLYPEEHAVKNQQVQARFTGAEFEGNFREVLSGNYLIDFRSTFNDLTKEQQQNKLYKSYKNIAIKNFRISNLEQLDKAIVTSIQFETSNFNEHLDGKIFINPLLFLSDTKNPFKADERSYPVFFNKPWAVSKTIYITIPDKYDIVDLPKEKTINLPDDLGAFNYTVSQKGQTIMVKASTVLNAPVVPTKNYKALKDFYINKIQKQQEKIVLQKK